MQSPQILRSLVSLATGIGLLLLAGNHSLPLAESSFAPQSLCHSALGVLIKVIMWAASDVGRAFFSVGIGAGALVSYLCNHRLKEARELGAAIATLLVFVIIAVATTNGGIPDGSCRPEIQALRAND